MRTRSFSFFRWSVTLSVSLPCQYHLHHKPSLPESSLDFISRLMALEALLCRYPSGAQASKSGIRKFTPPRRQWLRQSTLSKILSSEKDIFKLIMSKENYTALDYINDAIDAINSRLEQYPTFLYMLWRRISKIILNLFSLVLKNIKVNYAHWISECLRPKSLILLMTKFLSIVQC